MLWDSESDVVMCAGVMRKPLKVEALGEGLAGRGTVRIRLVRFGRKKLPYYRIIIASSRSRRDGRFLEMVGHYNPMAGKDSQECNYIPCQLSTN